MEVQPLKCQDQSENLQQQRKISTDVWFGVLEDDSGRHKEVRGVQQQMPKKDLACVLAKQDNKRGAEKKNRNSDNRGKHQAKEVEVHRTCAQEGK